MHSHTTRPLGVFRGQEQTEHFSRMASRRILRSLTSRPLPERLRIHLPRAVGEIPDVEAFVEMCSTHPVV